jgi:hypothetical protein
MTVRRLLALLCLCALATFLFASDPPDDITGMYSFLHDSEYIQLNLQNGQLSGWVTTFGFLESDRDTLIDRFFRQAGVHGNDIYFITKPLHGSWIEFSGHVERDPEVHTRAKEGYLRLAGRLTEYTTDEENKVSARTRDAVFKSLPDDSAAAK